MAKYTVELRTIVDSGFNIFNFDYSFYDPEKKAEFEKKFIDHFLFREIGQETPGRFMHYLKCKCNETLPYYNMLFRTALIDYEKTKNYNMLDTTSRTTTNSNNLTGTGTMNGTTTENGSSSGIASHTNDNTHSDTNVNVLTSSSDKTDTTTFDKTDTITESSTNDKVSIKDSDLKTVSSDTPQGLLAMANIKTNVYASKADLQDNLEKVTDKEEIEAEKKDVDKETTKLVSHDAANGTNNTTASGTSKDITSESSSGSSSNHITSGNTSNTSQNASGSENETITHTMSGSYGVITEADMLQKHIVLQKTLTTIEIKFFEECEDLFMQIF